MATDLVSLPWTKVASAVAGSVLLLLAAPVFSSDVTYEYDSHGRLSRAHYDPPNGPVVDYVYDSNGNRLAATVSNVTRGLLRLSASSFSGSEGSGQLTVTVERTGGAFGPARVSYATTDGTATVAGGDYAETHGELEWQNGDAATKTFDVTVLNDSIFESTKAFSVTLSGAIGAVLGSPATATAAIVDDDVDGDPPSVPGTPIFSNITPVSATASWTAASDNVSVTGYRYRLDAGSWQTLGNVTSVALSGLSCAVHYSFDVQARDAQANWGPSSSSSFTTADGCAPDAPGAPAFSAITATSATATWTAATDLVGVTGYRYRLNGGSWQVLGNVLTTGLTGLTCATTYTMELQARDAAENWSDASSNSFTTLDGCAPSTPGTPGFSSITATSVTVSWAAATDNVGVTGYRYRLNGGGWQALGNVNSVALSNLTCATSYTFEVQARDAQANWGTSSSNSFSTLDGCAPSAPGTPGFSSVTGASATASWSAASDNVGVTGYEYRLNGGGWQTLGNVTSFALSSLACSTSYTFEVRARDAAGNWGASSSNSFSTLDTCVPGAPGTPTFPAVTATSATAIWGAASDNVGVTGYRYRLNSGSWQTLGNVTSAGLSPLACSTSYTFEVQARDAAGNWGASSSNSFTTPDGCAPTAPGTPVFSSITLNSATAGWSAASDNIGVTGYQYRVNGGSWQPLGVVTSVGLSALSSGATYTFQVQARDAAGNWGPASASSFTTASPPSAPSGLHYNQAADCAWNASWNAASGATSYTFADVSGAQRTTSNTSISYGCPWGQAFNYKPKWVRACSQWGCSAKSNF